MVQVPALIVIGLWIVLQFFSGIGSIANTAQTGGVAYMAHIGGFMAGFVLTFWFRGGRGAQAHGLNHAKARRKGGRGLEAEVRRGVLEGVQDLDVLVAAVVLEVLR